MCNMYQYDYVLLTMYSYSPLRTLRVECGSPKRQVASSGDDRNSLEGCRSPSVPRGPGQSTVLRWLRKWYHVDRLEVTIATLLPECSYESWIAKYTQSKTSVQNPEE